MNINKKIEGEIISNTLKIAPFNKYYQWTVDHAPGSPSKYMTTVYNYFCITRCTRGVRVVFSVTRMRSSSSARINKFDFRTKKSCSVHMTVFEIVAGHNVVNWMQLLT